MPSETSSALASARVKVVESWSNLHPVYKVLGCVVFAWMAWRTVPVLSAILHLVVLAVGLLFVLACIGASEETIELLNNYRRDVANLISTADTKNEATATEGSEQGL